MSKYQQWYDSLSENTKIYLKNQPTWHDKDLYKAFACGVLLGALFGIAF